MTPQTRWIGGSYEAACRGYMRQAPLTERILGVLARHPGLTTGNIALELNASPSTTQHSLTRMEGKGLVLRRKAKQYLQIGATLTNHWFLQHDDKKQPPGNS